MTESELEDFFWKGEKVVLRQARPSDVPRKLDEYYDSVSRSFLQGGVNDLPPVSQETFAADYVDEQFSDNDLTKRLAFSIDTLDGEYVGWIAMHSRQPQHGRCDIGGISIFKGFRQEGYAADAVRILLRYGFHELRMEKCNCGCRSDNVASQKLQERLGFVKEGAIRRHVFTNNQFYDQFLYGMLKEEFQG